MNYKKHALNFSKARHWAAAALLAGVAAGAMAQSTVPATSAVPTAAVNAQPILVQNRSALTIRQVYDLLDAAGYRDLREIEWSDGRYEVKGRNAQGARVKLKLDGYTGVILRERIRR